MDFAMQSFKQEIEQMFEKTFQDLNQKNQLNKNILENLIEAANQQSYQILQLDQKLQTLNQDFKNSNQTDVNYIKREVKKNEEMVHQNFNHMMHRLQQIEQGIGNSRRNMQENVNANRQAQVKIDKMISQMQNMIARDGIPQYVGDREMLSREIQQFENMLKTQIQRQRSMTQNIQFSKKTILQPLITFQTKMAVHNRANEQILRQKLTSFTQKLRRLQKKVQQTTWMMNSQISKSSEQQRRIIQQMNMVQEQMGRLRRELEMSDDKRREMMERQAIGLDNMVEEMMGEAKRLEMRVEKLRKGYEDDGERVRGLVMGQKMTL